MGLTSLSISEGALDFDHSARIGGHLRDNAPVYLKSHSDVKDVVRTCTRSELVMITSDLSMDPALGAGCV